jgi:hypothetical protein
MTFLLTGLDIEAKANLVKHQLGPVLAEVDKVEWTLSRTDRDDPDSNDQAVARLTVAVKDGDGGKIGRPFSGAAVEIALASYPGATMTAPPGDATPYGVYQAAYIPNSLVEHRVITEDGTSVAVEVNPGQPFNRLFDAPHLADPPEDWGPIWNVPLGSIAGARSGDKGGNANLGIWVRTDEAYHWLAHFLDIDCFKALLPETRDLPVTRYELPNLRALNFVVEGLLGEGVASSTRQDPQAKGFGEWLRARHVEIPIYLIENS